MPARTYYIETVGCRANQADSEAMGRLLEGQQFYCAAPSEAELLVVNTCTVTCHADKDSRQVIRKLRRRNRQAKLLVTGCYAQRVPEELSQMEGVDCVLANAEQHRIGELAKTSCLAQSLDEEQARTAPANPASSFIAGRTRPLVKIQDGCDARCSFCIVPLVRGRARSAPPQLIIQQVQTLVLEAHQEIVLTGINLGRYGRKMHPPTSLAALVEAIIRIPNLGRLRLSGIEPMYVRQSLVQLAVESEKLAPHFHLPLQSGSARVLSDMRRPYRPAQYRVLVENIRKHLPSAAIGADVIVGFPSETESEHKESLQFVEDIPVTHLHVFSYSKRSGTEASRLTELHPELVDRRSREFRALAARKKAEFEGRFIGSVMKALTLQPDQDRGCSRALTGNFIDIHLPGLVLEPNQWVEVALEKLVSGRAVGRLVKRWAN